MDTDNKLRKWVLHHWEINKANYTGEIIKLGKNQPEHWKGYQPEQPIRLLQKSFMLAVLGIVETKLNIVYSKIDSDPALDKQIKRKKAVVAMLHGYFNGRTDEAAYKALEAHIQGKNEYVNLKDKSNEEITIS